MSADASLRHKLNKKSKLASGKSKTLKEGNKKGQSALNEKKSNQRETSGMHKTTVFDRKKKRVYADLDLDKELISNDNVATSKKKSLSKKGLNKVKDDFSEVKHCSGPPRSMWTSKTKRTSSNLSNVHEDAQVSNGIFKSRKGEIDKKDGSLEKSTRSKHNTSKFQDQNLNKRPDTVSLKSSKKTLRNEKVLDDDLEGQEDQPKKRKRVRLDPNDISNKRLDDGIVLNESTKEKKKDSEKSAQMSRNAQFRAIQPSPSILSFVKENLLGRRRLIELRRAGYNIDLSAPLDNIPFSAGSERERIEENIFRNRLEFFAAAKVSSSFPAPDVPEIAFAGRSNVGKSSLLNALTRQWGVVRTSDKPGLTQTINFFNLGPKLRLVDLPGYGFAYAKEEVKDAWEELVKEYVSTRVGLKRVCLLIDTKWGMKPRDRELIDLMERSQTKYQIVLTKTDVVFPIDVARRAMQIEESLKTNKSVIQPVMMASSKSGAGIRTLRTVLAKIARFAKV